MSKSLFSYSLTIFCFWIQSNNISFCLFHYSLFIIIILTLIYIISIQILSFYLIKLCIFVFSNILKTLNC
jgi:hypothetical protein